jgi:hypothetical protein
MHCQGAEDVAKLIQEVETAQATAWRCHGLSCPASSLPTLQFCCVCRLALCSDCGGPHFAFAPILAFVCVHCLVHADYEGSSLLPAPPGPAERMTAADRRALLKPLVRGRMHLLSIGQRASTRRQYAGGRTAFIDFCSRIGVAPFPCAPGVLMDFMVWCVLERNLDSSTVRNYTLGVGALYDYVRERLFMRHVRSPLRDPEVVEMARTLGVNFKKAGGGRLPLTAAELYGLFLRGFDTLTRRGRWARLYSLCLNFGMLRNTACSAFTVRYRISPLGSVEFLPGSEISIYFHAGFGAEIIEFVISSDKNVDARRTAEEGGRRAFVPGDLPHFGIAFAADLRRYLLDFRPPSGGPLLAYPTKKGHGFSASPCSNFNTYLRTAYKRAFPDVSSEYLQRLGTHSGRKTLAQLLWESGAERRLIADAGGWFIKREAVDLYFRTSALIILQAVAALQVTLSPTTQVAAN